MNFRNYVFITALLLAAVTTAPAQEFFESVPFPGGGITTSMVRDSAGVLYAAVQEHGVYRSFDDGENWEPTARWNGCTYPLQVFPDGSVWAGNLNIHGGLEHWIITTDQGESWHSAEETGRMDPGLGNMRVCERVVLHFSRRTGMRMSRDDGYRWDSIPGPKFCSDVLLLGERSMMVASYGKILYTEDTGLNWRTVMRDSTVSFHTILCAGDSIFIQAMPSRDMNGRLFVSDLSLQSWTVRTSPFAMMKMMYYQDHVWYLSNDWYPWIWEEIFHIGRIDTSGGIEYTPLGNINAYTGIPHPEGGMLFATDAGIVHHDPVTDHWSQRNRGMPPRQIHTLLETAPGDLLAGTGFGGLYQRSHDNIAWRNAGLFPDPVSILKTLPDGRIAAGGTFLRPHPGGLAGCERQSPLYIGSVDSQSWQRLDEPWNGLHDMVFGDDGMINVCMMNRVIRAQDDFHTVDSVVYLAPGSEGLAVPYSSIERISGDHLISTLAGIAYESKDGGKSWETCTSWPYLQKIRRISPGCILRFQRGYLLRSFDDGESWELLPTPVSERGTLLSAGRGTALLGSWYINDRQWQECWVITDNGSIMQHLLLDPETYGIVNCALHASDGYLYIGTSRGLFRSRRKMDESAKVHGFELGQHYPNPASVSITVPFEIWRQGEMRLSIHETTGREAWVVEDGWHAAGTYESVVPVNRLRAGVYFIRLQQGGESMIRKLVVDGSSRAGAPPR